MWYPPLDAGDHELFDWFDELSAEHWNFRRDAERNQAVRADLTPHQESAAMATAAALGLVEARPPSRQSYDHVLILGGLVRACLVRPAYAARLSRAGTTFGNITALGGFRPLVGDELDLASALGITAGNEMDAMVQGMARAFDLGGDPEVDRSHPSRMGNADWAIARFAERSDISVIAAPSNDPAVRRANTADTFLWWAKQQDPLEKAHILLITTAIYVPYQEAGAIRTLAIPHGATVETVGVPADIADLGPHTQPFDPQHAGRGPLMYWLWAVNLAGAVLIVIRVWLVALGRRPKAADTQRTVLREVTEKVRDLPSRNELIELWRGMPPAPGADNTQHAVLRLIWFLYQADASADSAVRRLDDACTRYVDICNTTLAVHIDDGLLNATRFVRSRPELHEELVRSIPLIEPLIWYKSLVRGMGRWGYRVLALHTVLDSLRVSASRPEIKGEMRDVIVGDVTFVHPSIAWPRRLLRRVGFVFVAPTINVRVKLKQRRRAVELARSLQALKVDLPDPKAIPW